MGKVKVHFNAVGNAPILRKSKFFVDSNKPFASLTSFLLNELHVDSLFLYCDAAFMPAPDALIFQLFECFASRGELVVNYSTTPAYG